MSRPLAPKIVAFTGGSGCGKSWLTTRLHDHFGARAARVSLDDFYRDRSNIAPARRHQINYDHPQAIDWPLFECWLRACRSGSAEPLPRYDFETHTRLAEYVELLTPPLILLEGLWLLRRPHVRELIDFSIFVECPDDIRLKRREKRDVEERGRSPISVRRQFAKFVLPMHERYVAPQARWADMVLTYPIGESDVYRVAIRLGALLVPAPSVPPVWVRGSRRAEEGRLCIL
jgi:uridine kinase